MPLHALLGSMLLLLDAPRPAASRRCAHPTADQQGSASLMHADALKHDYGEGRDQGKPCQACWQHAQRLDCVRVRAERRLLLLCCCCRRARTHSQQLAAPLAAVSLLSSLSLARTNILTHTHLCKQKSPQLEPNAGLAVALAAVASANAALSIELVETHVNVTTCSDPRVTYIVQGSVQGVGNDTIPRVDIETTAGDKCVRSVNNNYITVMEEDPNGMANFTLNCTWTGADAFNIPLVVEVMAYEYNSSLAGSYDAAQGRVENFINATKTDWRPSLVNLKPAVSFASYLQTPAAAKLDNLDSNVTVKVRKRSCVSNCPSVADGAHMTLLTSHPLLDARSRPSSSFLCPPPSRKHLHRLAITGRHQI